MKIIVTGGRDFVDKDYVFKILSQIHSITPITELVHGGAPGADSLAGQWAIANQIPCTVFKADWKQFGGEAGPKRNRQMAEYGADCVIAFPGGRGTADMIRKATKANINVRKFDPAQQELFSEEDQ